jgi:hypothetical protein
MRKPTLSERAWAASVLAAVFYVLFIYNLVDTEQQVALTILGTAICGLPVKVPGTNATPNDERDKTNNPTQESK